MSILEILEAHKLVIIGPLEKVVDRKDWRAECIGCEWSVPYADERHHHHRAHVAQVLEQYEREREAAALEEAADEIERLENIGDTAQDELNEEQTAEYCLYHGTPKTTWLRDRADQIRGES